MKNIFFLLTVLAALCFASCGHSPKTDSTKVDMAVVQQGQLLFYNHATQKLTPYEAEKDSVVNMAFDYDNHLYYTAANKQELALKCIDFSESKPQPKLCAKWRLKLDEITDFIYDTGASDLTMDDGMENIYLASNFLDDYVTEIEAYNIASGTTKGLTYDDYWKVSASLHNPEENRFFYQDGKFYRISSEGKVGLSDKIDLADVLDLDDAIIGDLMFGLESISPDGKKVLYSAFIPSEDAWGVYCVADSDGNNQTLLEDSRYLDPEPQWLGDGSLAYVGTEPRPKDDPKYDEWNDTRHCVKIIDPQGKVTTRVSDADLVCGNPFGKPQPQIKEKQASLEGCDMAIIDKGKVTFYNSLTNEFVPLTIENDSVINGVFLYGYYYYYTVAIDDRLYLKKVLLGDYNINTELLADWGLKLSDCVSETDGKVAPMASREQDFQVGIQYQYDDEYSTFKEMRTYGIYTKVMTEDWLSKTFDEEDAALFQEEYVDGEDEEDESDDNNYYCYVLADSNKKIRLSDKLDFDNYKSEYVHTPGYVFLGIGPNRDCVIFGAPFGWTHVGHGPLCFATLDGEVQKILDYDYSEACYGWLNNGKLAYADREGIHVLAPDGKEEIISNATLFVTVN